MTTYSSILAWKISWTEEPEGLQSIGLQRENSIETCISPYVKQMTSASLMYEAGHSKTVLWDNPILSQLLDSLSLGAHLT